MTAGPEQTYFDNLAAGRLRLQRCDDCSEWVFYPRAVCPHCGSEALVWRNPSGRGTVYSTSIVRRKPNQGGDHNVALITLEEGARLMSRVQGIAPQEVSIGMAVEAEIIQEDEAALLVFRPAAGAGQ